MAIGASVGKGGVNDLADVLVVQHLLNDWLDGAGRARITADGDCGPGTIAAITAYQAKALGMAAPDGLITPGGRTWNALAGGKDAGAGAPSGLSGAAWWQANQANYPNSAAIGDLVQPFRDKVDAFVKALRDAGAKVAVSATLRNRTRAHLMHYSWRVAKGSTAPGDVPAVPGLRIQWDHGDPAKSRKGAKSS